MSSTYAEPLAGLGACLDEIAGVDPAYRTPAEKQDLMVGLARVIARAQAEQLRVLACADDVADRSGARSAAAWLADNTHEAHGRVRADARLAAWLDRRWTQVAAAFAAGEVNLAQVRVIIDALIALPTDLGDDLLVKAESQLVEEAAHHGPRELRILGARVLSVVAPQVADEAEYQLLLAAERRATAATRLTLRRRGDGSTDLHARIPDHAAGRLRTYLAAFTAPRRRHLHDRAPGAETGDEFANLPAERRQGIGLVALLERVLKSDLPRHGGKATSVAVLIDYDTLVGDLSAAGMARTTSGETITAGQARRLACPAGIHHPRRPRPCPAEVLAVQAPSPAQRHPPPPSPRPRMAHPPPPQRHHHVHPTPIGAGRSSAPARLPVLGSMPTVPETKTPIPRLARSAWASLTRRGRTALEKPVAALRALISVIP